MLIINNVVRTLILLNFDHRLIGIWGKEEKEEKKQ